MSAPLDDRGVSEVLGAVLVFGIVVMLLGMLQTFAVPQENQEVEFQHSQQVADQMADLRATALDVARDGGTKTANVKLGTSYPTRFVLLNPPDATGTLRTTEAGEMELTMSGLDVSDACGTGSSVESRVLEYEPRYNSYNSAPTMGFEHGVNYRKYEDSVRIDGEQTLIRGNTITLLPFVGEYAAEGVATESIDIASTGMGQTINTSSNPFTLIVPTKLAADTWRTEEQLLAEEISSGPVNSINQTADDRIEIELEPGTYTVSCAVLGVGTPPAANPPNVNAGSGFAINPNSQGAVIFRDSAMINDSTVKVTLENTGGATRTIDLARVPFYDSDGQGTAGGAPAEAVSFDGSTPEDVGGPFTTVSIDIPPRSTENVTLVFYCKTGGTTTHYEIGSGDYFVLSSVFADDDSSNYFISPQSGNAGNGNSACA